MPYWYLTLLMAALDQATKLIIASRMFPFQSINVCNGWIFLTYVRNFGAAFSILKSQTLMLIGLTLLVFLVVWVKRHQILSYPKVFQLGLALALGGALGNSIDRIRLGYVIDFIDLQIWPVFNLADVEIVVGVGLVILGIFQKEEAGHRASEINHASNILNQAAPEEDHQ